VIKADRKAVKREGGAKKTAKTAWVLI